MYFETGGIYHIYNQGNNRQAVFYNRENYLFFIRKIRHHILPFTDVLAWCLMPNHFHLMVEVKAVEVESLSPEFSEGFTLSEALTNPLTNLSSEAIAKPGIPVTLNHSIGVLLRSYTRAINAQENRTGSLFRKKTKAICLNEINGISSHWYTSFGVTFMKVDIPEYQYPQVCFNYIHSNPVKAGLVTRAEDWEFSSYIDLVGMRDGTLVNRGKVDELRLICR
jgi:putative transposase